MKSDTDDLPCGGDHDPHEDCMVCVSCGECREDLDNNDVCPDCGGKDDDREHEHDDSP